MKAMILAAGRGKRLMPYTQQTPKPLLMVGGISLLERNVNALYASGVREIFINTSWLGSQIEDFVAQLNLPELRILSVYEGEIPLGTGGGVFNALKYLQNAPFWVVNADIITNYPFSPIVLDDNVLAHLVLVTSPDHNQGGDFGLDGDRVLNESSQMYTFSGISLLSPEIFQGVNQSIFSLVPLLRKFIGMGLVKGELFLGKWLDVGTIERLNKADGSFIKAN